MKTDKKHLQNCILVIIVSIFYSFSIANAAKMSTAISDVHVVQLDLKNYGVSGIENSCLALIMLTYIPGDNAVYVNIFASLDSDPNNAVWAVKNLFLPDNTQNSMEQFLSVKVDLKLIGFPEGDVTTIYLYINEAPSIVQDMALNGSETLTGYDVGSLMNNADNNVVTLASEVAALETYDVFPVFTSEGDYSSVIYRGCEVPNIDLDNATYPDNMPTYAGDENACAPASATNSLLWLAAKNAEITLPPEVDDERELITALSDKMKRSANSGVSIEDFIRGKLDFINDQKLLINVKFQSESISSNIASTDETTLAENQNGTSSYPTWDWLKEELDKGEDVEMCYYWWDGDSWRGHAVVVTGAADNGSGNLKTIYYKHDHDQSQAGGTVQEAAHVFVDEQGRMRLYEPDPYAEKRPPYVGHLIAESPGDPITPVELGFFTVRVEKNTVNLTWRTESETNNYGFEIYRNQNKIAFVKGYGTTVEPRSYSYRDVDLAEGTYLYELVQVDFNGDKVKVASNEVNITAMPTAYALSQNYPNPFNAVTKIHYAIPQNGFVTLKIYSILGEEIVTLVNEEKKAGNYTADFNAKELVSGVYFYRIESGNYKEMKKFILLK